MLAEGRRFCVRTPKSGIPQTHRRVKGTGRSQAHRVRQPLLQKHYVRAPVRAQARKYGLCDPTNLRNMTSHTSAALLPNAAVDDKRAPSLACDRDADLP